MQVCKPKWTYKYTCSGLYPISRMQIWQTTFAALIQSITENANTVCNHSQSTLISACQTEGQVSLCSWDFADNQQSWAASFQLLSSHGAHAQQSHALMAHLLGCTSHVSILSIYMKWEHTYVHICLHKHMRIKTTTMTVMTVITNISIFKQMQILTSYAHTHTCWLYHQLHHVTITLPTGHHALCSLPSNLGRWFISSQRSAEHNESLWWANRSNRMIVDVRWC